MKKRIIVMASGTEDGGGSGFLHLLLAITAKQLDAEVIGVISTHPNGGVRQIADQWGIPFVHMSAPYDEESYRNVVGKLGKPDLIVLWGWLKMVKGLDNFAVVNIHPARIPEFGGKGMYGLKPHEEVLKAKRKTTQLTIHWVNDIYDGGKVIFAKDIDIQPDDTPQTLQNRVKQYEWHYYPLVIQLLLQDKLHQLPDMEEISLAA